MDLHMYVTIYKHLKSFTVVPTKLNTKHTCTVKYEHSYHIHVIVQHGIVEESVPSAGLRMVPILKTSINMSISCILCNHKLPPSTVGLGDL